jgi:hypothetical protein
MKREEYKSWRSQRNQHVSLNQGEPKDKDPTTKDAPEEKPERKKQPHLEPQERYFKDSFRIGDIEEEDAAKGRRFYDSPPALEAVPVSTYTVGEEPAKMDVKMETQDGSKHYGSGPEGETVSVPTTSNTEVSEPVQAKIEASEGRGSSDGHVDDSNLVRPKPEEVVNAESNNTAEKPMARRGVDDRPTNRAENTVKEQPANVKHIPLSATAKRRLWWLEKKEAENARAKSHEIREKPKRDHGPKHKDTKLPEKTAEKQLANTKPTAEPLPEDIPISTSTTSEAPPPTQASKETSNSHASPAISIPSQEIPKEDVVAQFFGLSEKPRAEPEAKRTEIAAPATQETKEPETERPAVAIKHHPSTAPQDFEVRFHETKTPTKLSREDVVQTRADLKNLEKARIRVLKGQLGKRVKPTVELLNLERQKAELEQDLRTPPQARTEEFDAEAKAAELERIKKEQEEIARTQAKEKQKLMAERQRGQIQHSKDKKLVKAEIRAAKEEAKLTKEQVRLRKIEAIEEKMREIKEKEQESEQKGEVVDVEELMDKAHEEVTPQRKPRIYMPFREVIKDGKPKEKSKKSTRMKEKRSQKRRDVKVRRRQRMEKHKEEVEAMIAKNPKLKPIDALTEIYWRNVAKKQEKKARKKGILESMAERAEREDEDINKAELEEETLQQPRKKILIERMEAEDEEINKIELEEASSAEEEEENADSSDLEPSIPPAKPRRQEPAVPSFEEYLARQEEQERMAELENAKRQAQNITDDIQESVPSDDPA